MRPRGCLTRYWKKSLDKVVLINTKSHQSLTYAVDIALLEISKGKLLRIMSNLKCEARKEGNSNSVKKQQC